MEPNKQGFFNKIAGEFDTHVKQSIPMFSLVQSNVAENIAKYYQNSSILDVCGSTGELGRQCLYAGWTPGNYTCLDGSPKMQEIFSEMCPKGMFNKFHFDLNGFMCGWTDESGIEIIPAEYTLANHSLIVFDIAVEILGFQFFTGNRVKQIEVMSNLAPICIFFEKFTTNDFVAREVKKDNWYKNMFFTAEEIANKQKDVLDDMHGYLYDQEDFELVLNDNFETVIKFAQIGNFAGYIGANTTLKWDLNSRLLINKFN